MKKITGLLVGAALTLAGLVGITATPAGAVRPQGQGGYWMMTDRGTVYNFGGAEKLGDTFSVPGRVKITPTPTGNGYWILSESGSVEDFGDAGTFGVAPYLGLGEVYASMAATPSGSGYWLFTNKGRVLPFGDAQFYGDMTGVQLAGPVLDAAATASGEGYFMVASDGGIFTFGDARFVDSMGGKKLNKPVMSMAVDPDGYGYWLVASDGGIFAFAAPFYGSAGKLALAKPISGIVASPTGAGYLMVAEDGGAFTYGDVPFYGSLGKTPPAYPVVAIAPIGPPQEMEWRTLVDYGGSDAVDHHNTQTFQLGAAPTEVTWFCGAPSDYSAGCSFILKDFKTGSGVNSAFPNAGTSGSFLAHPKAAGLHYIDVTTYTSGATAPWSVTIRQQVCVRYC